MARQMDGEFMASCLECKSVAPCMMGWCERDVCTGCQESHRSKCLLCRQARFTDLTRELLLKAVKVRIGQK